VQCVGPKQRVGRSATRVDFCGGRARRTLERSTVQQRSGFPIASGRLWIGDRSATCAQFKQIPLLGDKERMRRFLSFSLILCLSTSSGCMVIDELDAAASLMPDKKKTKEAAKAEEAAASTAGTAKENPLLRESREWWNRATSLAPTELESSIVSCRLRGGTQFMSRDDCLSRGGKPGSVSG